MARPDEAATLTEVGDLRRTGDVRALDSTFEDHRSAEVLASFPEGWRHTECFGSVFRSPQTALARSDVCCQVLAAQEIG